jgi:hypothetical protein
MDFYERDWKRPRALVDRARERACARALGELRDLVDAPERTAVERFRAALELLNDRRRAIDDAMGDMRRSTAALRLHGLLAHGFVEPDELEGFSEPVRDFIAVLRTALSRPPREAPD